MGKGELPRGVVKKERPGSVRLSLKPMDYTVKGEVAKLNLDSGGRTG